MKKTGECPKCHCQRIARVPRVIAYDGGAKYVLAPLYAGMKRSKGFFSATGALGSLAMHICGDCGYSELFVDDVSSIQEIEGITWRG